MKYIIAIITPLFFLSVSHTNLDRVTITIEKIYPNNDMIEVSASEWVSSGTIAIFNVPNEGDVEFLIYRSLSLSRNDNDPRFLAKYYPTGNGLSFDKVQLNMSTVSQVLQTYDEHSNTDREYWESLTNRHFRSKWLNWEKDPERGEALALNASYTNVEGYLSLLEIREDRIIVRYPVKGGHQSEVLCASGIIPRRSKVNLTYSNCSGDYESGCEFAYVCETIKPKKRDRTMILAIISEVPRPLSHFMAKNFGNLPYYDNQNLIKVDPRTIGPGFDVSTAQEGIGYHHPDLLPVDSWDVNILEYYVR